MRIEFDPVKNEINVEKHGISLDMALCIDKETAYIIEDSRNQYGERRLQMFGFIEERLFIMVFTLRDNFMRVISLRKANEREKRRYKNARKNQK